MTSLVRFVHHSTIAIVPPSATTDAWVWDRCQGTRYKLRDRGYYRWPPHCNLIYPFIDPDNVKQSLSALTEAAATIEPFTITLSTLDTFGGYNRGVLWLDPVVLDEGKQSSVYDLQSSLTKALRSVHGTNIPINSRFRPHMTLCHYPTLSAARAVADDLADEWSTSPVHFDVREVYIMERRGDDGQFRVAHRLPLRGVVDEHSPFSLRVGDGDSEGGVEGCEDTFRFPFMPLDEPPWVREVRGDHKAGRRAARGRVNPPRSQGPQGRLQGPQGVARTGSPDSSGQVVGQRRKPTTDTPEQIAAKREQRAAKKAAALLLTTTSTATLCDPEVSPLATAPTRHMSSFLSQCPPSHTHMNYVSLFVASHYCGVRFTIRISPLLLAINSVLCTVYGQDSSCPDAATAKWLCPWTCGIITLLHPSPPHSYHHEPCLPLSLSLPS